MPVTSLGLRSVGTLLVGLLVVSITVQQAASQAVIDGSDTAGHRLRKLSQNGLGALAAGSSIPTTDDVKTTVQGSGNDATITQVINTPDGKITSTTKNGVTTITTPDGKTTVTTIKPAADGSGFQMNTTGSDGSITATTDANGGVVGTIETPDGKPTTFNVSSKSGDDGTVQVKSTSSDGNGFDATSKADGTTTITTADGKTQVFNTNIATNGSTGLDDAVVSSTGGKTPTIGTNKGTESTAASGTTSLSGGQQSAEMSINKTNTAAGKQGSGAMQHWHQQCWLLLAALAASLVHVALC